MIRALAFGLAPRALILLPNPPTQKRTCPACGTQQDADRQTCTQCLIPDPPRPTGSEGQGRGPKDDK